MEITGETIINQKQKEQRVVAYKARLYTYNKILFLVTTQTVPR